MNLYLGINIAIVAIPLFLSFDKRVHYVEKWGSVFPSLLITASAYLLWDVLMTAGGAWSFNERYSGTTRLLGLPLGEILFFICVPFSCLFIYEVVNAYLQDKSLPMPRALWIILALLLSMLAILFRDRIYTLTVLLSGALFFLLAAGFQEKMLKSRNFWIFMAICYVPFILFNGILTALPVVMYSSKAIWNVRVYTIPLEDFFYSFSLLGFNALLYSTLRAGGSPVRSNIPGWTEQNKR